jgi:ParB-like chromosome segregation protein Spo0J
MSETHQIVEPLLSLKTEITKLHPDASNARTHSEANIEAIKRSLLEHGMRFPVVVQKKGMIVRAGNARLEAAKQLGWTHVAAIVIDEQDSDALKFALRDNKTAELAEWDYEVLSLQLKDLAESGLDVSELGFSESDLDVLLTGTFNPASPSSDAPHEEHKKHFLVLTEAQNEVIQSAVALMRGDLGAEELTDGRCVELICADYLAGR